MVGTKQGIQVEPDLVINGNRLRIQRGQYTDLDVLALEGLANFMASGRPAGLGDAMVAGYESLQAILGPTFPAGWWNPEARRLKVYGGEILRIVALAGELLQSDPRYQQSLAAIASQNDWVDEDIPTVTEPEPEPVDSKTELLGRKARLKEALALIDAELGEPESPA